MNLFAIQELLRHAWTGTTARYVHVHSEHVEQAWASGQQRAADRWKGLIRMKWNLRLAAANRGIWKASELHRMLADRGMVVSAGKMSGLWSGQPNTVKLKDLDVLCAVLGCGVADLLLPEPEQVPMPAAADAPATSRAAGERSVTPRPGTGRSLPPR